MEGLDGFKESETLGRCLMYNLLTVGQAAGSLIAIFTLFGMLVKFLIVKPIKSYIDQATSQIAPNANGGSSLNDANKTLIRIENRLEEHLADHDTRRQSGN